MIRRTDITVICDCCESEIARVLESELSFPLQSSMFQSMMPFNGVPDPFDKGLNWEYWKCPYCHHRPFICPNTVTTVHRRKIKLKIPTIEDLKEFPEAERTQMKRLLDFIIQADGVLEAGKPKKKKKSVKKAKILKGKK